MRRIAAFAAALLVAATANGQGTPRGFWTVPSATPAHDSWQRAERDINPNTVATNFKLLWKIKLGSQPAKSFQEPLLYPGMITGRGFKDFVFSTDATTLYAVDSELGELVWKKDFTSGQAGCGGTNIQAVIEAPKQIRFGAPRPASKPVSARPPAPPPSEEPMAPSARRVGVPAGGGYFGLKGIYVLTSDGYLHEQIMATGLDYAPPVKFIATPGGSSFGLNLSDRVIYAAASSNCKSVVDALWTIDLNNTDYKVNSYKREKLSLAGLAGPAIGADGTAYVTTGSGTDTYANSIVALSAEDLKVKDWYTSGGKGLRASPAMFTWKSKEYVVAPGKDGTLVLLDSTALGGADHHTPLAQSEKVGKPWDSFAAWQDKSGSAWVFASSEDKITAFKVDENGGKVMITPAWTSPQLKNPAPPVVANGVVFALDGGSSSTHATLYALDAATGKQLYSSGDAIQSYTHMAGMSVGDGHVFFRTHDNTLYSFGIPLEH